MRLSASLEGLPIPSRTDATGRGGFVLFEHLPLVDRMLGLQVGDDPRLHRVAPEVRRLQANLRVLVPGDAPTRRVRVAVEAPGDVTVVQVRPAGAVAFGRVPFEVEDLGVVFSAPAGDVEILLRAGTRWGRLRAAGDEAVDVDGGALVEGVVVGGTVDGARPGTVVRFFREVAEGAEAVLGDGFEVRVEPSGTFEARLPSGRYLVEVATRTGSWRRPATLAAQSPGARLHLALESP